MAPPPPPELMDDVIGEILLRLPPNDPACLVRASLVCKPWRHLLCDGAFLQQYRAFHRTPPVLGFFQHQFRKGIRTSVPLYVPTIQPSPVPQPAVALAGGSRSRSTSYLTVDCRHGRVLYQADAVYHPSQTLTVWDPVTGDQRCIDPPVWPVYPPCAVDEFSAAVLCAATADGCDHLRCSRGPFLVVIAGICIFPAEDADDEDAGGDPVAWASLYSSETGAWSASTSINVDSVGDEDLRLPSLLVGDAIYFILEDGERILKYSLVGGVVSVMKAPPQHGPNMIFAAAQDGELGTAIVEGYSLHLWSWRATDPDGAGIVGEWARSRATYSEFQTTVAN